MRSAPGKVPWKFSNTVSSVWWIEFGPSSSRQTQFVWRDLSFSASSKPPAKQSKPLTSMAFANYSCVKSSLEGLSSQPNCALIGRFPT